MRKLGAELEFMMLFLDNGRRLNRGDPSSSNKEHLILLVNMDDLEFDVVFEHALKFIFLNTQGALLLLQPFE